jgi:hypothetical protein
VVSSGRCGEPRAAGLLDRDGGLVEVDERHQAASVAVVPGEPWHAGRPTNRPR